MEATTHFNDAHILAKVSRGLGAPMTGIGMDELDVKLADREVDSRVKSPLMNT